MSWRRRRLPPQVGAYYSLHATGGQLLLCHTDSCACIVDQA